MTGERRIEQDAEVFALAERLVRDVMVKGLDAQRSIDAVFSALMACVAIAGWTVAQAEHYVMGSLRASFGADKDITLIDAAEAIDDGKVRS